MITRFFAVLSIMFLSPLYSTLAQHKDLLAFPMMVDLDNYATCDMPQDSSRFIELVKEMDLLNAESDDEALFSKIRMADLNADGSCELLHYYSGKEKGQPHESFSIYRIDGGKLVNIGHLRGVLVAFGQPEEGKEWLRINAGYVEGGESDPKYYNAVYSYDGEQYSIAYDPKQTRAEYRVLGLDAFENDDLDKALVYFQNAYLSTRPIKEELLHDANNLSMVLMKLDRKAEATELLMPLLKNNTLAYPRQELATAWYWLGMMAEDKGNKAEALTCYERACRYRESAACDEKIQALTANKR